MRLKLRLLCCLFLFAITVSVATPISLSLKDSVVPHPKKKIDTTSIRFLSKSKPDFINRFQEVYATYKKETLSDKLAETINKQYRTFPSLDTSINKKDFTYEFNTTEPEFTQDFITENFPESPAIDSLKEKAEKVFDKLKELGKYAEILTGDKLIELPVGLKGKDSTGNSIIIAVSQAKMFPKYAELQIFAKLSIPQQNIDLFFGAEGVKFSHDGAFLGDTKLVLLGNQPIPFNANNWLLTLKGSANMKTGTFGDNSFITVNCKGIKEISLEADLRVSRNVLLPIDSEGNYVCSNGEEEQFTKDKDGNPTTALNETCYVGTSFSVKAAGWNDLLAEISLPNFEITGFKGWGFNLGSTVLDLSDTRNSPNVNFPEIYDKYLIAGNETLWRGVYASSIEVTLPKAIVKNGNERTQFGATDLILDSNGISGNFYGNNILKKGEGSAGKWPFTIDSLEIKLEVNKLKGGALSGNLQVPIMEKSLGYEGWISPKEYGLKVTLNEKMNVPIFLAEMELKENSSVTVKVLEDNIYPSANLTGSLTVKGNIGQKSADETLKFNDENSSSEFGDNSKVEETDFMMPGIVFEELEINTEPSKPFIKAQKFEYTGNHSAFNFPVNIDNVKLLTPTNTKVGLGFDLTINFDENGSNATTKLEVMGKVENQDNLQTWKYDQINIEAVNIDIERSGVKIKGGLEVMKDDPTYGDGFSGDLQVDITKIKLQANAKAMFGNKDFRYWFVDVWTDSSEGGDSKLLIKKFVGGLSYAMKKTSTNSNWTPSESTYVPFADNGLSLKAGIEIATKSKAFQGKAFLEMDFNKNGGLNRIGFTGDGSMMLKGQSGSSGGTDENNKSKLNDIGNKIDKFIEDNQDEVEELAQSGNYLAISKDAIPKGDVAAKGNIGVYVGIEKDFTTDTFHGEFEVYIDLEQIRGASDKANPSNTLAGRAVIHTSPDKWYLHIGTPETPISLAFIVPPETFTVNAYFMTGNVMPNQIPPHYRVLQILGNDIMDSNRSSTELSAGRGFAFGLSFEYRKDFKQAIFYAFIEAGIGFDVMHREYPNASCVGRSGPLGNNGWYSMGQIYAYLYGEFGVSVKLFGSRKSFKILEAGLAALLRGQFPNPSYFEGYVGAYYSVMGGLVSGRMRLHVDFGEKCVIQRSADDGLEVPIIADTFPIDKDKDIDVFTSPQVVFNYGIDRQVTILESTGEHTYKIELKEAKLSVDGVEIPTEIVWSENNTTATFDLLKELLPSEKNVTLKAKVTFQEKIEGSWKAVMSGGKEVNETKEVTFNTSKAPDYIPLSNVEYMYPVKDQQYFFPEEFNQGYIQLDVNQAYLFDSSYNYKSELTSSLGEISRSDLNYDAAKRRLYYSMPNTQTNTSYKFDVMVFPKTDDIPDYVKPDPEAIILDESTIEQDDWFTDVSNTSVSGSTSATAKVDSKSATRVIKAGESKSLLDYSFKTSKHNTFKDKMKDLKEVDNITEIISYDVHYLHLEHAEHEPFEILDVVGTKFTDDKGLMSMNVVLDNNYYTKVMKPLLYKYTETLTSQGIAFKGKPEEYNLNPYSHYSNYLLAQPESNFLKTRFPFLYDIVIKYKEDYLKARNHFTNEYYRNEDAGYYDTYKEIIDSRFPIIQLGTYKTNTTYTLPGNVYKYTYSTVKYKND